ncbi:glycosyltransferase [bacterium]|nr:glycosyltransferase [bacterium]
MKKIKLLRIISNLGVGGVQKRMTSILPKLDKERYSIIVCSFKSGELQKHLEQSGISVRIVQRRFKFDPVCIYRLCSIMKKENIDIVHTHCHKPNTTGRFAAKLAGVSVIIANEHNVDSWKSSWQLILDRWLAVCSDKIIAVSEAVKNFYVKNANISADKFEVIYNGVDLDFWQKNIPSREAIAEKKSKFGLLQDDKVIATIGRLHSQKGHEYLLRAARKIIPRMKNLKFLIVGDGPMKDSLESLSERLGIKKNVVFTGKRDDIKEVLYLSDISVLSSIREGFSNVVLESMACGKPVVATDVGGNKEIVIDGENGFIVPFRDKDALADKILALVGNEELIEKMGLAAKETVKNFSLSRMAHKTEHLYEKSMGKKI